MFWWIWRKITDKINFENVYFKNENVKQVSELNTNILIIYKVFRV